ncbi:craniofacial development protein 1-like isoform X1 [Ananas comosus]|uniref:Craniofacial development protein 1-like isoform X1 n=3 Tax=Ananas comosus TaxID=4615 RepID=A0A6P5EBK7_ANACO|nr:craniofacial development protein 1-like isoform X1 [Ananas comosus]
MSTERDKGTPDGITQEAKNTPDLMEQFEEYEAKARVEDFWKKMNSGLPAKTPKFPMNKPSSTVKRKASKKTPEWMIALGLAPRKASNGEEILKKRPDCAQNGTSEEAKKLAAAALAAVRDATFASTAGKGKVEITEVRDFAGQEIEVKKLVDADSKEAAEKAQSAGVAPTALDAILEQIKKKQKLTVLDKTKKDWGEFKEDNKGMEEELDAYKKSSNQYLDKVSFLQRADLREFERERDARLASQAKRRTDMRED